MPRQDATPIVNRRRHVTAFAVVFGLLLLLALYCNVSAENLRYAPVAASRWQDDQAMVYTSLTRRHFIMLRLGILEQRPAPGVLMLGGHRVKYFSSNAFGADLPEGYFFNSWQGNISVREARDFLIHLEKIGKLPTELALISIAPAHFDGGKHVIDFEADLPFDLVFDGLKKHESTVYLAETAAMYVAETLSRVFNYSYFLVGLLRPEKFIRIFDYTKCPELRAQAEQSASRGFGKKLVSKYLPRTIRAAAGLADDLMYCSDDVLAEAMRSDGSTMNPALHGLARPAPVFKSPPRSRKDWVLRRSDVGEIVRVIGQIREIAKRNGIKVAFFVQPLFEDKSAATTELKRILAEGLAKAGTRDIVDHTDLALSAEYFKDATHPIDRYFKLLVTELRNRGFLTR